MNPTVPAASASRTLTSTLTAWVGSTWLWADVIAPLALTRLLFLIANWVTRDFAIWPGYGVPVVHTRGWQFSSYRLMDMWGRWDARSYIELALQGYVLPGPLTEVQSNLTFFPLYSYFVRVLLWLIPDARQTTDMELLAAVVVSNLFLLGALALLYLLVQELTQDRAIAQRTILYLLLFPTAFFFSCAYSEATFLFFAVAAFYAAQRRAWFWAALAAALLGITRPLGILIVPCLAWLYLDSIQWRISQLRLGALWLLLTPVPLLLHFWRLYALTGDWLAPVHAQQAYFRGFAWPWTTIFAPTNVNPLVGGMEQLLLILFLVTAVVALWRLPSPAYGVYIFLLIVPPLFTGTLTSMLRYLLVAFPVFIVLAQWGRHPYLDRILQPTFLALQIILVVAWSRFYWVS